MVSRNIVGGVREAGRVRPAKKRLPERAVHALWSGSDTLSEGLVTHDGQRLRVIYPGRPNSRAGPDFLDAVIRTESGETLVGDVEVHLDARDWYAHGHHTDPNYNGVILHVVFTPSDTATAQSSGMTVPVAAMAPAADLRPRETRPASPGGAMAALDRAGEERFLAKSRGFAYEMAVAGNADQVAYEALFEALGYASNRRPFLQLARRVPFEMLCALRSEPPSTRTLALKAMLTGAAGLLGYVKPAQEGAVLARLRRRLPPARPGAIDRWRLFRVRPANHPVRRVLGAACLLDGFLDAGIACGMLEAVQDGDGARVVDRFVVTGLIGKSRALDVAVNAVLPVVHAWAGLRRDRPLQDRCLEAVGRLPPPSENEITREMRRLMGIPRGRSVVSSAQRHQGLIHLYRKHVGRVVERRAAYAAPGLRLREPARVGPARLGAAVQLV